MGATVSVASAGMVRTPLGKAVAESPSFVGRAPAPPELKRATSNSGGSKAALRRASLSIAVAPPRNCTIQSEAAPSAGTRSGIAWCRQPNTRSGSMWPMTWRAATGQGRGTLRMEPSGADTVSGASEPALLGMSLATMHLRPKLV